MPSTILVGAKGQPGPAAYPSGIVSSIFNELNFVIPDYIPGIIAKYGNTSYMLASEILGNSVVEETSTTTNTYSHFEKGRPFGSGIVAATVASGAVGSPISVVLKSPQSYADGAAGTQSPFLLLQTIKVRSNGKKYKCTNITRNQGAFIVELTPMGA